MKKDKKFNSPEQWATEAFAEMAFHGNFQIVRNFFYLLLKTGAASLLVFFRYRFGARAINAFTILWGGSLMSLFWMAETAGKTASYFAPTSAESSSSTSVFLFWLHWLLFLVLAIYHIYEARKNLSRLDGKESIRHGQDTGLSIFYPIVAKGLTPFGVIYNGMGKSRWYHLNEYKFQKWVEPLVILLLGFFFKAIGFAYYGTFLMLGAICIFLMISMEEENYLNFKQKNWDSQFAANILTDLKNPEKRASRHSGMVVQKAMLQTDADFRKWKAQQAQEQIFDTVELPATAKKQYA